MVALTMRSEKLKQKNRQNHSVPCRDRNQCLREDIDVLLLARFSPRGLI